MAWGKNHPNYKPASGIPAKGVGKGDGWGGPARGNAGDRPATPTPHTAEMRAILKDPIAMAERKILREAKADRIEQLIDHLCDLGLNAEREETQASATVAALNRLEGMPKQKNENVNVEVTFEDLVKQIGSVPKSDG